MYYIVQMADFHFGGACSGQEAEILGVMREKIRTIVPKDSPVVLCACGDYIDSRPVDDGGAKRDLTGVEVASRYVEAGDTIRSALIEPLRDDYQLTVGLCAGNHDITHESEMNQFSRTLNGHEIQESYALRLDEENVDFIFVNSCPPMNHKYGQIDYTELEAILESLRPDSTKYLVLHHTLMSMDEDDHSPLRQVPPLIKLMDQYAVKAVFHGHTHGQYTVRVGLGGCPIVGVGTVYVRDYPNVNSQFNLIRCENGVVQSAVNYRYNVDLAKVEGSDGFEESPIHMSKDDNCFRGGTFSEVYDALYKKVRAQSKLYHVRLYVKSGFEAFCSDVRENFGKLVELETLDKQYTYAKLAEMWEAPERDEEALYFNHGEHFRTEQYPSGIDCLIHEIGEKKTSSRALMSTINSSDIAKTDPDSFLPSLLSIQAGFSPEGDTLHISMNLRALEVSRFLKINICEILYVAQRIHDAHPFANIEAEISAFRVQVTKRFGCFLKAKLDTKKQKTKVTAMLTSLVFSSDREEIAAQIQGIIRLILDKKQRSETVIETAGIQNLLDSILTVKGMLPEKKAALDPKLERIAACVQDLLDMLGALREKRKSASEPTQDMRALEVKIPGQYDSLVKSLEELIPAD